MKIECLHEKLKEAVSRVEKLASKNASLAILETILVSAQGNKVTLRATNLHVGAEIEISAKVEKEGIVAIKASVFNTVIGSMYADKTVVLESNNGNIIITSEHTNMTIKGDVADEFPTLPSVGESYVISMDIEQFVSGVKSVAYAAAVSDIKPELSSVYLYHNGDGLVFVATDSFRLAEKKMAIKDAIDFPETLIPVKNVSEIVRLLQNESGSVELHIQNNQISFITKQIYITSRVFDGTFPDYRQILPKETFSEAVVLKSDLQQALKGLTSFSDKFRQIDIYLDPENKKFELRSLHTEIGNNITTVDAAISGEGIETSINAGYLADCLQSIPQDSLSIRTENASKPLIVEGVSDTSFTYLIMPMNR